MPANTRVDLYVMLGGYAVIRFNARPLECSDTALALEVPRSECSDLISGGLPCFLETRGRGRIKGEIARVARKNGCLVVRLTFTEVKCILEEQGRKS